MLSDNETPACRFFKAADWTKFFCNPLDETAALVGFNLDDYFPWLGIFRRSMRTKGQINEEVGQPVR